MGSSSSRGLPAQEQKFSGVVTPLGSIKSVKNTMLDDEHDKCAQALRKLQGEPTAANLLQVKLCYEEHFQHEEKLLDEHVYSLPAKLKAVTRLSVKDLKRIILGSGLSTADCVEKSDLILRAQQVTRDASDRVESSFSLEDNMRKSHFSDHARLLQEIDGVLEGMEAEMKASVPLAEIDKILRDFEYHANKYDDSYVDQLSKALADT